MMMKMMMMTTTAGTRERRGLRQASRPDHRRVLGIGKFAANAAISHQSYAANDARIPAINKRF